MISSLKGKIEKIWGGNLEIEVGGIGYLVYGPAVAKALEGKIGEEVKIYTYMAVSENDIGLFGFESWDEVNIFKMLISVSGVGPRTGAQILASCAEASEGHGGEKVIKAIENADVDFFQKIKGIGKKTAQRIIIDLKSNIGGLGELDLTSDNENREDELWMSLKQLGFEKKEIERVTKKLPDDLKTIEDKLGWCLNNIN